MNQCATIGDDFTCKSIEFASASAETRCITSRVATFISLNQSGAFRVLPIDRSSGKSTILINVLV